MRYLIDTDILIDHLRGETKARDFLKEAKIQGGELCYSVIAKAELYAGLRRSEEGSLSALLAGMDEVVIDGDVAVMAGRYKSMFQRSRGVLLPDALVAASAKQNDAVLVTLNGKHYPMKDIEVMVPYTKV
jgi:predicted nucleic acid-binding protein